MRMDSAQELVAQGSQELERLLQEWLQGRLALDPSLGMRKRLEDAPSPPDGSLDDTAIDQKQQDNRSLMQRHRRPVFRVRKVVLEMQARVASCFLEEGDTMLVIAVQAVVGELSLPVASQIIDQ